MSEILSREDLESWFHVMKNKHPLTDPSAALVTIEALAEALRMAAVAGDGNGCRWCMEQVQELHDLRAKGWL